jgi:hypothetical protein
MSGLWTEVDRLEDPDSAYAQEAVESASYIMWVLSGRRYGGVRTTTETYCQNRYGGVPIEELGAPVLVNGDMYNLCGTCMRCAHTIKLRGRPIINITEVLLNDNPIALEDVEIIDRAQIAPKSYSCWGSCADVTLTYQYGAVPPIAGVHAATALANQFIWANTDDDRCSLPQRVTSVSRQGVSWTLLDTQDFLEQGRTGVYSVDLFLRTVNPDKARMRPRVFSPDLPTARTRRSAAAMVSAPMKPPSAP